MNRIQKKIEGQLYDEIMAITEVIKEIKEQTRGGIPTRETNRAYYRVGIEMRASS